MQTRQPPHHCVDKVIHVAYYFNEKHRPTDPRHISKKPTSIKKTNNSEGVGTSNPHMRKQGPQNDVQSSSSNLGHYECNRMGGHGKAHRAVAYSFPTGLPREEFPAPSSESASLSSASGVGR
eukprot:972614-Amphidinium_carterae.1